MTKICVQDTFKPKTKTLVTIDEVYVQAYFLSDPEKRVMKLDRVLLTAFDDGGQCYELNEFSTQELQGLIEESENIDWIKIIGEVHSVRD